MRITRTEFEGAAGRVAIERPPHAPTMRIDSIVRKPGTNGQVWKTWHVSAHANKNEQLEVARELQYRTDGVRGTTGDIAAYLRELERFAE
jgi:hypothetical protein